MGWLDVGSRVNMLEIEGLEDEAIGVVGLLVLHAGHVEERVETFTACLWSPSNSLRRLVRLLEIGDLPDVAVWSWNKSQPNFLVFLSFH